MDKHIVTPLTSRLEHELTSVLMRYCGERGDSEGAVETLERIIREREILLKNGIKHVLLVQQ
jgi:hypothetical protein